MIAAEAKKTTSLRDDVYELPPFLQMLAFHHPTVLDVGGKKLSTSCQVSVVILLTA